MTPIVSVIMANYNSERYVEAAVRSALGQSIQAVEVIVVDDRSSDNSVARLRAMASGDPRLVVEVMPRNGGPAAARNRALDLARGQWVAILDSDDFVHPARFERLIACADDDGADLIADDLLLFDEDNAQPPRRFLDDEWRQTPWIGLADYLDSGRMFNRRPGLGFLKPMIRRAEIERLRLRYDERLRIAEDDLFVIRLLSAGLRYRLHPDLGYFYRKHGQSISHRITARHLEVIAAADAEARAWLPTEDRGATGAMDRRQTSYRRALAFTAAVSALKARQPARAAVALAQQPGAIPLLRMLGEGALAKLKMSRRGSTPRRMSGIHRAAVVIHGRVPEMARLNSLADGLSRRGIEPYAILTGTATPSPGSLASFASCQSLPTTAGPNSGWTDADRLFVATHARPVADLVIAVGDQPEEALVFALRPDMPMAVLEHAPGQEPTIRPVGEQPSGHAVRRATVHCAAEVGSSAGDLAGLLWLAEIVWPLVQRRCPNAQLTILAGPAITLPPLPPHVARISEPDSMTRASQVADVIALPFISVLGGPDRVQAALAHGRPVVAAGAVGPQQGRVTVATDAEDFAQAILAGSHPLEAPAPGSLDAWLAAQSSASG